MLTDDVKRYIDRLIRDDFSQREDELRRAEIEHSRKLMSDTQLKDYVDDVKFGKKAMNQFGVLGR